MLVAGLVILALLHLAVLVLRNRIGPDHLWGFYRLFDLGSEGNVPTLWTFLLLLACSLVLLAISTHVGRLGGPYPRHWRFLALGFAFLAVDEAAQVHERVIARIWGSLAGRGQGITYYVWYLPLIPVVLAIGLAYIGFVRHLPPRYRRLMLASGALYLGGAIGMELVESVLAWKGQGSAIGLSQLVEESFEIAGVSLFLVSLIDYWGSLGGRLDLQAEASPSSEGAGRPSAV